MNKSLFLLALVVLNVAVNAQPQQLSSLFDWDSIFNFDTYNFYNRECKNKNFITLPLGTGGGLDESNLSAFLLTRKGSNVFVSLDAGTIWGGIAKHISARNCDSVFDIQYPTYATARDQKVAWFLRNHVMGYFLGHSHLDHLEGLIEVSPEDVIMASYLGYTPAITDGIIGMIRDGLPATPPSILKKKVLVGTNTTVASVKANLFNNVAWPNLPAFGRYNYVTLDDASTVNMTTVFSMDPATVNIAGSIFENMQVSTFQTCHNDIFSTAYIFTDQITGEQIVFFSDTGVPTGVQACDYQAKINNVWRNVQINKLKAIYLECSFTNNATDAQMFGHLRPRDIMSLLNSLVDLSIQTTPPTTTLSHVKLIVQHIKPQVNPTDATIPISKVIYNELTASNPTNIKVVIPEQGVPICF